MTASVPVHGHCEPRFQAVRDVFEKNIREGLDLGAAVAFSLDGEPVVDLWGGYVETASFGVLNRFRSHGRCRCSFGSARRDRGV